MVASLTVVEGMRGTFEERSSLSLPEVHLTVFCFVEGKRKHE